MGGIKKWRTAECRQNVVDQIRNASLPSTITLVKSPETIEAQILQANKYKKDYLQQIDDFIRVIKDPSRNLDGVSDAVKKLVLESTATNLHARDIKPYVQGLSSVPVRLNMIGNNNHLLNPAAATMKKIKSEPVSPLKNDQHFVNPVGHGPFSSAASSASAKSSAGSGSSAYLTSASVLVEHSYSASPSPTPTSSSAAIPALGSTTGEMTATSNSSTVKTTMSSMPRTTGSYSCSAEGSSTVAWHGQMYGYETREDWLKEHYAKQAAIAAAHLSTKQGQDDLHYSKVIYAFTKYVNPLRNAIEKNEFEPAKLARAQWVYEVITFYRRVDFKYLIPIRNWLRDRFGPGPFGRTTSSIGVGGVGNAATHDPLQTSIVPTSSPAVPPANMNISVVSPHQSPPTFEPHGQPSSCAYSYGLPAATSSASNVTTTFPGQTSSLTDSNCPAACTSSETLASGVVADEEDDFYNDLRAYMNALRNNVIHTLKRPDGSHILNKTFGGAVATAQRCYDTGFGTGVEGQMGVVSPIVINTPQQHQLAQQQEVQQAECILPQQDPREQGQCYFPSGQMEPQSYSASSKQYQLHQEELQQAEGILSQQDPRAQRQCYFPSEQMESQNYSASSIQHQQQAEGILRQQDPRAQGQCYFPSGQMEQQGYSASASSKQHQLAQQQEMQQAQGVLTQQDPREQGQRYFPSAQMEAQSYSGSSMQHQLHQQQEVQQAQGILPQQYPRTQGQGYFPSGQMETQSYSASSMQHEQQEVQQAQDILAQQDPRAHGQCYFPSGQPQSYSASPMQHEQQEVQQTQGILPQQDPRAQGQCYFPSGQMETQSYSASSIQHQGQRDGSYFNPEEFGFPRIDA